jgi:hypothetical protein
MLKNSSASITILLLSLVNLILNSKRLFSLATTWKWNFDKLLHHDFNFKRSHILQQKILRNYTKQQLNTYNSNSK